MTILPNIEEAMEDARNGKLSPYWQNNLKRECLHRKLSAEERQALSELNRILTETPQWSGEEELCIEMENIGGRVCFCHFWDEHYSMVQLTEDRNGKYSAAYVLDVETTPDVRKVAALQAQKELADCMQVWGVSLLDTPVPEQMKYDSLAEAASARESYFICSGTDEVRFSCRSRFLPHASFERPRAHHRVKSVPKGCAACIGKCRSKGLGAFPQQAFCNAKSVFV